LVFYFHREEFATIYLMDRDNPNVDRLDPDDLNQDVAIPLFQDYTSYHFLIQDLSLAVPSIQSLWEHLQGYRLDTLKASFPS